MVAETDERHGAPDFSELIAEAPEDIRHVFAENVAIPWFHGSSEKGMLCAALQ